jgi:hypothetical protein
VVEDPVVDPSFMAEGEAVPEHFLAWLYGISALVLGAAVWSAMVAVSGPWALPAVPALGWMIAWACRYGGRRTDTFVRVVAWVLVPAGVLLALFAFSTFSVTQTSPVSGFQLPTVGLEYVRLFTEPPWLGSAAILLALAGAGRALRDRPARPATARRARRPMGLVEGTRLGAPRSAADRSGSRDRKSVV